MCEVQGVCMSTRIWWCRNACNSQRGRILVYMSWMHEERDFFVWVALILVWVFCNLQDLNSTFQCYEEGPMGVNWIVCNFWMNKIFFVKWVEASKVVRQYLVSKGGRLGSVVFAFVVRWSHAAMYFSYWSHMVRWICVYLRKDVNCGRWCVLTKFWIYVYRSILGMLCMMAGRPDLCIIDVYVWQ